MKTVVEMRGIDKRFPDVHALKNVHFDLSEGEVHALMGENGAGKSTELTKAILTANPDLKGIFGANEGSALGVVNGVTEMNRKEVVIIGYDSGQAQKDAIRSGVMAGAITQNPVGIGYETVKAAVAASKGEAVPSLIDTGFCYYDAETMDDPKIAAVLYD